MNEQLDFAPCGYVSLADDGTILSINQTLLKILEFNIDEVQGRHINGMLTKSSQTFYQLYFFPMLKVQMKVEEIFLTLRSKKGEDVPVLLNGARNKQEETFISHCIIFPMRKRYEYEQVILAAKKGAEESNYSKEKAIHELEQVRRELECKQKELLEVNDELERLSVTDELTGLHNRRSYEKALTENLSLFRRTLNPFSLLMIDIDHFKNINDTYGHLKGDYILRELACTLKKELREYDIPVRYGGEEFALILPNTKMDESILIAERLRRSVETADCGIPSVTISIGIATVEEEDTKRSIQKKADEALYVSKNVGRNQTTHASQLCSR